MSQNLASNTQIFASALIIRQAARNSATEVYHALLLMNMACCLLNYYVEGTSINKQARPEEASMNLSKIDVSKCDRVEKEVVEGLCLSYDMIKGVCLETMEKCTAMQESNE